MISVQNHLLQLSGNNKILIAILFLGFNFNGWSQSTVNLNGASYYIDTVEAGETLFSLYKRYNVSVDDIKKTNQLEKDELALGQILYIPIRNKEGKSIILTPHKVKSKETIYGISKSYNVSVESLIKFNPSLSTVGLKKGETIKIPLSTDTKQPIVNNDNTDENDKIDDTDGLGNENSFTNQENIEDDNNEDIFLLPDTNSLTLNEPGIILHVVLQGETLYRISKRYMVTMDTIRSLNDLSKGFNTGDTLKIPKKITYERPILTNIPGLDKKWLDTINYTPKHKNKYKVLMLLPLHLQKNSDIYRGLINRETFVDNVTYQSLDFYMGFKLAMDSLSKAGLNVDIVLIDTKGDTNIVSSSLQKNSDADIIIGPIYNKCIKTAIQFSTKNSIPIILPAESSNQHLKNNPLVIKALPSKLTMLDQMTSYIVEEYNDANIILVNSTSSKDKFPYDRFMKVFNDSIQKYPNAYTSQIKTANLGSSSGRDLSRYIKKDTMNIIVAPSVDLGFCTNLLTRMNKVTNSYDHKDTKLAVFGLDDWNNFNTVNSDYKNKTNLHYPLPFFVERNDSLYHIFICKYRTIYNTDPGEMAVNGFDLGQYFFSGILTQGTGFLLSPNNSQTILIQNIYNFKRTSPFNGIENNGVQIILHSNFEKLKVNTNND